MVTEWLDGFEHERRKRQGTELEKARLNVHSAKTAARWHGAAPSKTLDTHLAGRAFVTNVAMQLGVDVYDDTHPCSFCGSLCDMGRQHALSCTCGGDMNVLHDAVKHEIFRWCQRARLRPYLEKEGLLAQQRTQERRRPADVLVCRHLSFLDDLPGEAVSNSCQRVALDVAVINALGQDHRRRTAEQPLAAAIAYGKRKANYQSTKARCIQEGIAFEPLVFEAQGGIEPRAAAILHRIAELVAALENGEVAKLKAQMMQRIATIIATQNALAIARRDVVRVPSGRAAAQRAVLEATALQMPQ